MKKEHKDIRDKYAKIFSTNPVAKRMRDTHAKRHKARLGKTGMLRMKKLDVDDE